MSELPSLDPTLHQPVRTQIVAYLVGRQEATFSELKRVLGMTDGNLDAHLKKLLAAEYLTQRRETSGPRAQTLFAVSPRGLEALTCYTRQLQSLLALGATTPLPAGNAEPKPL